MKYLKITIGIFLVLAASRFIPHPPNFTSLIALSFYIPAILGLKFLPALLFCFAITDLIIGFSWNNIIYLGKCSCYRINFLKIFQKYLSKNYWCTIRSIDILYNYKFWSLVTRILRLYY